MSKKFRFHFRFLFFLLLMCSILGITLITNAQTNQPFTDSTSSWRINDNSIFGDKISMVSETDGWIIRFSGTSAYLYRWNGTNWTNAGSISHTQDIVRGDISMVSATDGWIVLGGPIGGGAESVIYRWDGHSWTLFDTVTDPNEVSLSSLDMVSTTDGWAAAGFKFGSKYYHWDGNTWTLDTNVWLPLVADEDIDMVSATDGWAVGFTGKITHWDGNNWLEVNSPVTTSLNSISMVSASDGWAVGGSRSNPATILHWDGIDWLEITSPVTTTLNSISMVSATDGWAVGDDGVILHWDGSAWEQVNSPTITNFNTIAMVSNKDGWISGYGITLRYEVIPSLSINFAAGAPGSYFSLTGTNFPANNMATINVNGQELGIISTNSDGELSFQISTTNANEGSYFVAVRVNATTATTQFKLDASEPVHPQDSTGAILEVPSGIAFTEIIFLPLVLR